MINEKNMDYLSVDLAVISLNDSFHRVSSYEVYAIEVATDGTLHIYTHNANDAYCLYAAYSLPIAEDSYDTNAVIRINTTSGVIFRFVEIDSKISKTHLVCHEIDVPEFKARIVIKTVYPGDFDKITSLESKLNKIPNIKNIWYNKPYTSIVFEDNSVTKAKVGENDVYSPEIGVYICLAKEYLRCLGIEVSRKNVLKIINEGVDLKKINQNKIDKKLRKKLEVVKNITNDKEN